jgi:subtilisin family serine protease
VVAGIIPLTLAATLAPTAASGGVAADPRPRPAVARPAMDDPSGPVRITLVTGDTVVYTDSGGAMPSIAVELDPDSGTRQVAILRGPDGIYAIPDQVQPLIDADRLDRELFDVEYLATNGYTDAERATLPLIVTYDRSASRGNVDARTLSARTDALPATEAGPRALRSINGAGVEVDKASADRFWRDIAGAAGAVPSARADANRLDHGIAKVWLDRRTFASLDESRDQIGVPSAWRAGVDGSGAKVAVLDTGYDTGHPDLAGQVSAARSFVPDEPVQDGQGHGTHVASTIAGTGTASSGRYAGVAPGADLLVGKVLSNGGWGLDSWIIAGMEWAGANADVVNMSLGSYPSNGKDPMSQAVDRISAETGALFVIAAGNFGPGERTVTAPSTADSALAVAAVDPEDRIADFSSRGPRTGDGALKPEVAAPGNPVVAAWAAGTDPYPGVPVGEKYVAHGGTSMASPHVAGVAAMLVQRHPEWSGQQLKDALMSTSFDAGLNVYQQGAGRVDAARASSQRVFATGKADLGTTAYPVPSDARRSQKLIYTNTGDSPVTLDLEIDVENRRGVPAGDALSLTGKKVTVPARGQAAVELTLDPALGDPGEYSGAVRGRGAGGIDLRTAVAFVVEGPRYEVTVELTDRYGGAPTSGSVVLHDISNPNLFYDSHDVDASGRAVFEVPPGDYTVQGFVRTADRLDPQRIFGTDVFAAEALGVRADRTVRVDGTRAVDIEYDVQGEHRSIEPVQTTQSLYRTAANGDLTVVGVLGERWDSNTRRGAIPTGKPAVGTLSTSTLTSLREPLIRAALEPGGSEMFTVTPEWTGRFEGTRRPSVVDVGAGRPEDYEGVDVKGKVVLVTSNESYVQAQVETATAHGAFAVLVTRDAQGMIAVAVDSDNKTPVLGTPYEEGVRLRQRLARGPVRLRLTGVAESTFTYTLRSEENGAIPGDLTYRFRRSDLAVMSNAFHSEAGRIGTGALAAYEAWEGGAFQYLTPLVQPTRRTDYVSAGPELRQRLQMSSSRGFLAAHLLGDETAYRPRQHVAVSWFKAPIHPTAVTELPCNLCRSDYILRFAPNNGGDSVPGHRGIGRPWPAYTTYRNGTLVENPDLLLVPGPATYRIDRTAEAPPDDEHLLANRSHTSWTFRSQAPERLEIDGCRDLLPGANECAALPLIMLGYDLPLGLDNSARADRSFDFVVRTGRAKGYRGPAEVAGMRVMASYDDGASWRPAATERNRHRGGEFRVELRHPRLSATNGYVTLRVDAWDNAGNRTVQTIERAYKLR